MTVIPEGIRPAEVGSIQIDNPRLAMDIVDSIIRDIYLPFRGAEGYGTERAVLVAPPHVYHRENDAEHSWHIGFTGRVLYDNRELLGLTFPDGFDMAIAEQLFSEHDILEIITGDVDALTQDQNQIDLKAEREAEALKRLPELFPYLGAMALRLKKYEERETPESQYVSDIDKIAATRIIFLDGGKKWHDWNGNHATEEHVLTVIRAKLKTPFGHSLFDILEQDIHSNPLVFPPNDEMPPVNTQLPIFR